MEEDSVPIDVDPATLEIFKTVLGSPSGKRWLERFIIECVGSSHIIIRSQENGVFGYIKAYNIPEWSKQETEIIIKPEDSWIKKWIKRQLI